MKLTDIEVKGRKFEVEVDIRNGRFSTLMDGYDVCEPTLDALKSTLARRISRSAAKVSIPFVRWDKDKGQLRKGTLTGIHASNRNLLVRWEGQKGTDQEWGDTYIRPGVGEKYAELCRARDEANRVLEEFEELHGFEGKEAVREELAKQGVEVDE